MQARNYAQRKEEVMKKAALLLAVVIVAVVFSSALIFAFEEEIGPFSEGRNFHKLPAGAGKKLNAVRDSLIANPESHLYVIGGASSQSYKGGANKYRHEFDAARALRRASAVVEELVSRGISRERLHGSHLMLENERTVRLFSYVPTVSLPDLPDDLVRAAQVDSLTNDWFGRNRDLFAEEQEQVKIYVSFAGILFSNKGTDIGVFGAGIEWPLWRRFSFYVEGGLDPITSQKRWDGALNLGFGCRLFNFAGDLGKVSLRLGIIGAAEFLRPTQEMAEYYQKMAGIQSGVLLELGRFRLNGGIGRGNYSHITTGRTCQTFLHGGIAYVVSR